MPADPADIDRQERFKRFLQRRLLGLVANVDHPRNADERFPMASGVIVEVEGDLLLITAAHFLRQVMKWHEVGRLLQLGLVIHPESGGCDLAHVDLQNNLIRFAEDIDIGFVLLDHPIIQRIIAHGGKAVRIDALATGHTVPQRFILVGLAASAARLRTETIAATDEHQWQLVGLSALSVGFAFLHLEGQGDAPWTYKFTPINGLPDYSGTSGGPIFGYEDNAAFDEYCLFAIQSAQVLDPTREQRPKHLIATAGVVAVEAIRRQVVRMTANRKQPTE